MEHRKLSFEAAVVWKEKTSGLVVAPNADDPVEVATPIQFPDGEEGKWSPESLFLGAISSCFMTTFLSFAKRKNLAFIKFRCRAQGDAEVVDGKFQFTRVSLTPELQLMEGEQTSLAEEVLARAEKHCLISNSVKACINVRSTVSSEEVVAAG